MRLKLDKKTGKVMFGADVQSVFDIAWYTFSRCLHLAIDISVYTI
jgi:hypothetical protein